ncbi:hypothetical protein NST38_31115 [Paenibacillus sp. FSL H8-0104]|uniref:hypothetical protein n=1 Tax=Paenibacillus sp. FSL H8-0104 TaxID=2954509 RepID=UPI0030FDE438
MDNQEAVIYGYINSSLDKNKHVKSGRYRFIVQVGTSALPDTHLSAKKARRPDGEKRLVKSNELFSQISILLSGSQSYTALLNVSCSPEAYPNSFVMHISVNLRPFHIWAQEDYNRMPSLSGKPISNDGMYPHAVTSAVVISSHANSGY